MPGFESVAQAPNNQTIRIASETEQHRILRQQEEALKQQRLNPKIKAQQVKDEEEKKKKNKSNTDP